MKTLSTLINSIKIRKKKLSESCDDKNKIENLNDCCQCIEDLLGYYSKFLKNIEEDYKKIYLNAKDLFAYYIERIKLKGKDENNIKDIIQKIKKFMTDLISE